MKQIKLTVQGRDGFGRGPNRRLRAAGKIPAVVYGKHKSPISLAVDQPEVAQMLKSIAGVTVLVELLQQGDEPRLSILQEVQRDPVTDRIVHIDFHEVSATEKMETRVAIHLMGESFGVKNQNGLLDFVSHQVDIRCYPKDLPEYIEVDVSHLKLGESIHVRDLKVIDGVEYTSDKGHVIVACTEQKIEVAPAAVETVEAEAAPVAATGEKTAE